MARPRRRITITGELPPQAVVQGSPVALEKAKRTVGYVRVSSPDAKRQAVSPEAQRQIIRDYCHRNGLLQPLVIEERASAATIRKRPEMVRMLEMCRSGLVANVVVYDLTRLFRDVREALNAFHEIEHGMGVVFHSASQANVDIRTAEGRLIRGQQLVYGQYERERISERTKAALAASTKRVPEAWKEMNPAMTHRYKRGTLLNGTPPFGYKWGAKSQKYKVKPFIPCPHEYPILLRIHELADLGMKGWRIFNELAKHGQQFPRKDRKGSFLGPTTIKYILKRGYL